jgi:hypothetical protein
MIYGICIEQMRFFSHTLLLLSHLLPLAKGGFNYILLPVAVKRKMDSKDAFIRQRVRIRYSEQHSGVNRMRVLNILKI